MTNQTDTLDQLAERVYDRYGKGVGGTTWDGKPLPKYNELGARQKEGWRNAARLIKELAGK